MRKNNELTKDVKLTSLSTSNTLTILIFIFITPCHDNHNSLSITFIFLPINWEDKLGNRSNLYFIIIFINVLKWNVKSQFLARKKVNFLMAFCLFLQLSQTDSIENDNFLNSNVSSLQFKFHPFTERIIKIGLNFDWCV